MSDVTTARFVPNQRGVIVECKWNGEGIIHSPITGLSIVAPQLRTPWMTLGTFVSYDVRLHEGTKEWIANNIRYLGEELEMVPYLLGKGKLQLRVHAVVCRSDSKTSSSWLWNDAIGRIYVPPVYFRRSLMPMDVVNIIAMYKGEHEDVPWTAVNITEMDRGRENHENRKQVATMLTTSDGWTVSRLHCHENKSMGFFTFLRNASTGQSAFAAWTDYDKGELPPTSDMVFRVSYFTQTRYRKHSVRAVLVTPLGEGGKPTTPHFIDSPVHAGPYNSIQMIPPPPPLVIPVNNDRTKGDSCGSSDSRDSVMTSTQSEMEMLVDSFCLDDYSMTYHSDTPTTPLLSPSPFYEFMPLFIGAHFDTWHPTEEEKTKTNFFFH